MFATVNVLGEQTHYGFTPGHTRTVQELQAALTKHGFPAKLAGRLPGRHAFVRAFRKWLVGLNGAEVNHSTSEYVEHITEDSKPNRKHKRPGLLTFQVDRAHVNGSVTYGFHCTATYNKTTGQIDGTDAAIIQTIAAELPNAKDKKHKSDLNRLLRRLERHMIRNAIGTMPFGANVFVPAAQKPMLDRLLAFVLDIGGYVTMREEVTSYAPAQPPAPGTAPPPPPPVPAAVSTAISDRLHDAIRDADKAVWELNTTKWTSPKREERKRKECWDIINSFLGDLNQYHTWLNTQKEVWNDLMGAVEHQLTTGHSPPPEAPAEQVTYVDDPTDDISVIEVVSVPALPVPADHTRVVITGGGDDLPTPTDPRDGKIHWCAEVVQPGEVNSQDEENIAPD